MSALTSVTLAALGFTTPDGAPLFTDLSLSFGPGRTGLVGRNGTGKTSLLRLIAGELTPASGQVLCHGRVAMLRQVHAGDQTLADLFGLSAALALLDRAEAGDASAEDLAEADWTLPARLESALLALGLSMPPETPLGALSGGQVTRAALAAVLFDAPDILLLDEPTNNLDAEGRAAVLSVLAAWDRAAIIVSHDRELLEQMDAIVELTTLGAARFGGGYSAYRDQKAVTLQAAGQALDHAARQQAEVARRAQQAAERKARSDAAGRRVRARGDQPKLLLDARKDRAEGTDGSGARLREARAAEAGAALEAARARVEILQPMRMDLPPTGLPNDRIVLRLDRVTGGHDPAHPIIRDLSLTLTGPERLAITGPNGSGKSTLMALITGALSPLAGTVARPVPLALLDQSVSLLAPDETLREAFLRLNPGAGENTARATLARFLFRAEDALQRVSALSGGQRLRAGLACTLGGPRPPALLLLDEPTNHLDLDATEALEAALAGYDGALVVVSHDTRFLEALAPTRRLTLG